MRFLPQQKQRSTKQHLDHQRELMGLPPRHLHVPIFPTFLVTSALLPSSDLRAVILPTGCGTRDPPTRYRIDPLSEQRSVRRLNSSWQQRTALPACTAAAVTLILMSRHCKCVHLCSNREEGRSIWTLFKDGLDGRQGIKEGNSHTDEVRVSFLIISNSLGLIIWKAAGSNEKVVEQKKKTYHWSNAKRKGQKYGRGR